MMKFIDTKCFLECEEGCSTLYFVVGLFPFGKRNNALYIWSHPSVVVAKNTYHLGVAMSCPFQND